MSESSDDDKPEYMGSVIQPARQDVYGDSTAYASFDFVDTKDEHVSMFVIITNEDKTEAKIELDFETFFEGLMQLSEEFFFDGATEQMIAEIEENLNGSNDEA